METIIVYATVYLIVVVFLIIYHSIKVFNHKKNLPIKRFVFLTAGWPFYWAYFSYIGVRELIRDILPPKPPESKPAETVCPVCGRFGMKRAFTEEDRAKLINELRKTKLP